MAPLSSEREISILSGHSSNRVAPVSFNPDGIPPHPIIPERKKTSTADWYWFMQKLLEDMRVSLSRFDTDAEWNIVPLREDLNLGGHLPRRRKACSRVNRDTIES